MEIEHSQVRQKLLAEQDGRLLLRMQRTEAPWTEARQRLRDLHLIPAGCEPGKEIVWMALIVWQGIRVVWSQSSQNGWDGPLRLIPDSRRSREPHAFASKGCEM